MSQDQFKVIYIGKLKDGYDINQVSAQFATKFNLTPEKAKTILQSGKEVVLNKKSEHVKAYKLKSAFEELGMQVRLERLAIVIAPVVAVEEELPKENNHQSDEKEETSQISSQSNNQAFNSWSMEPREQDNKESVDKPQEINSTFQAEETANESAQGEKAEIVYEDNSIMSWIKKFGGLIVGLGAGALLLLKKFGLFKLLKIGAVMAAASAIGFDPEEACMDNGRCEDAVDDQMDACWESNGFEEIDWDNMTAEEYIALKPKIENEFIGCFKYEDSGERIFVSPIDLRFDLVDFCDTSEVKNCNELVEPQIKSCFERNDLGSFFNESTTDYYQTMADNSDALRGFYSCFVDENGIQLLGVYDD